MQCVLISTITGSLGSSVTLLRQSAGDFHYNAVTDTSTLEIALPASTTGSLGGTITGSLGASVTGSLAASTAITLNATWCYKRQIAT